MSEGRSNPIPNSEVKPSSADGTARGTAWESRSLPGFFVLKGVKGDTIHIHQFFGNKFKFSSETEKGKTFRFWQRK